MQIADMQLAGSATMKALRLPHRLQLLILNLKTRSKIPSRHTQEHHRFLTLISAGGFGTENISMADSCFSIMVIKTLARCTQSSRDWTKLDKKMLPNTI